MSTPRLIGHPDFIPTSSSPVAVLLEETAILSTGAWSIGPITVTSSGAYMISLQAPAVTDTALTDVTVVHKDVAGNVVWTDFFGAVPAGLNINTVMQLTLPTILRGNIYGSTITVVGNLATAAYCNTVFATSGQSQSGFFLNIYAFPNGLTDPDPKMSNGGATTGVLPSPVPGNLLASFVSDSIGPASSSPVTPLVPYAGHAVLLMQQAGISTTPTNARVQLQGFTVANSSGTPVWEATFINTSNLIGYEFDINIPACLVTVKINNVDAAQTGVFNVSIVGDKAA